MKKKFVTAAVLMSIAVLVLAACAPASQPAAETQPPAAEEPTQPPAASQPPVAEEPAPTQAMPEPTAAQMEEPAAAEIDVEALIIEKVAGNHDVERIFNAVKTREEWEETLDRMIGYGAQISEEEKQIMIDYLLSRQP